MEKVNAAFVRKKNSEDFLRTPTQLHSCTSAQVSGLMYELTSTPAEQPLHMQDMHRAIPTHRCFLFAINGCVNQNAIKSHQSDSW